MFFDDTDWRLPASLHPGELELVPVNETGDLENTKRIYTALMDLTVTQAVDERLWTYLTHVTFWEYMRIRWPLEKSDGEERANPTNYVLEHYFFTSNRNRALVRNGISRLWWFGYTTYDDSRKDPFELTAVLLRTQDLAHSIMERTFSLNRNITRGILSALFEMQQMGFEPPKREILRALMRHLIQLGGVTVLDALDEDEVMQLTLRFIGQRYAQIA